MHKCGGGLVGCAVQSRRFVDVLGRIGYNDWVGQHLNAVQGRDSEVGSEGVEA